MELTEEATLSECIDYLAKVRDLSELQTLAMPTQARDNMLDKRQAERLGSDIIGCYFLGFVNDLVNVDRERFWTHKMLDWFPRSVLTVKSESSHYVSGTYGGWTFTLQLTKDNVKLGFAKKDFAKVALRFYSWSSGHIDMIHGWTESAVLLGDPAVVHADLKKVFMALRLAM